MATEVLSPSPVNLTTRRMAIKTTLKFLNPGLSKLTTVETKRIISVLDDTIIKVELVTMFSYVMENLEDFSIALGQELSEALKEHEKLSNNMEVTLAYLEEEGLLSKGVTKGNLFGADDPSSQLQLHVEGLKSSVRNILRWFYMNPMACQAVRDAGFSRNRTADVLLRGLTALRRFLFEMLLTTPSEEKEKLRFMQEITLRDWENRQTIAALEEELALAIHNRDEEGCCEDRMEACATLSSLEESWNEKQIEERGSGLDSGLRLMDWDPQIAKKNAVIKDLKTHLHSIAKYAESQNQRIKTEAEKQQKVELRTSQSKCAKTHQEIQQLRAQLNAIIAENRETELTLRKKKYKVEIEIENWVQKYDIEMLEKQEELEEIDVVYTIEKEQLAELREKFALLDQEFCQIMEERLQKKEQREKAEKELAILSRAATLIQALWKGYLVRSVMKSKRRKKGKGQKGKK